MTESVTVTSSAIVTMTKAVIFAETEVMTKGQTGEEAVPVPAAVPLQPAGRDTDAGRGLTARSVTAGLGTVVTGSRRAATSVRATDSHSLSLTRAVIEEDITTDITLMIRTEARVKQGTGAAGVGMMVAEAEMSAPAAAIEAGVQASSRAVVDLRDRGMAAAPAAAGQGAGVTMGGGVGIPRVKAGTAVPKAPAGSQVCPPLLLVQRRQTATCQRASRTAESSGQVTAPSRSAWTRSCLLPRTPRIFAT